MVHLVRGGLRLPAGMVRWSQRMVGAAVVLGLAGAVLLAPVDFGVTRIGTAVDIARPPAEVYAYVTTPGHWPEWHPSSLAVHGDVDHSLLIGETVIEDFQVAGRRGQVTWQVAAREPGRRWQISGDIDGREAGTVTYRLPPVAAGTHFVREFDYRSPNLLFAVLNALSLRRRIAAESQQAVRQLKDRSESPSKHG